MDRFVFLYNSSGWFLKIDSLDAEPVYEESVGYPQRRLSV